MWKCPYALQRMQQSVIGKTLYLRRKSLLRPSHPLKAALTPCIWWQTFAKYNKQELATAVDAAPLRPHVMQLQADKLGKTECGKQGKSGGDAGKVWQRRERGCRKILSSFPNFFLCFAFCGLSGRPALHPLFGQFSCWTLLRNVFGQNINIGTTADRDHRWQVQMT